MELLLSDNEKRFAEWNYASQKGLLFRKGENKVVLTDKRLISATQNKKRSARCDVDIDKVKGVSVSYAGKYYWSLVIFILYIGYFAFCMTMTKTVGGSDASIGGMIYYLIPSIIPLIYFIMTPPNMYVDILTTAASYPLVSVNGMRKSVKKLRLKLDKEAARALAAQLSAAISDVKSKK